MRYLMVALGALLCLAKPAYAAGPAIGPLCIDGVKAVTHPERAATRDNGTWTPTDYTFDASQADKAYVVILDRSITPTDQFETCAATQKRMVAEGAKTILSGRVRSLKLSALVFDGPGGNRFQIEPGEMDLTLGRVESGARPVIGGTIDFRGSKLWIGATQTILATQTAIRGELDVEAYNRSILGARIALGGLDYVADLRPTRPSNVSVRLDLATGQAKLWTGILTGQPKAAASGDLTFPYMTMGSATLKAARVDVVTSGGRADASATALSGTAASLSITNSPLIWKMANAGLTIGKAAGTAQQTADRLSLANPELTAFAVPNATASLESSAGETLFTGKVVTNFATLSERRRTGTSTWTTAKSPVLAFLMPDGVSRLVWNETGNTDALVVSGNLSLPKLNLGGMELTQPLSMALQPTRLSGEVVIPIKVDLPAAKGAISFLNGDQTVAIEGRLDRLAIDGKLIITVPTLSDSRFEAASGKVNLAIGAALSVSPVVAGAKANFLNAQVTATNLTDLRVAKAGNKGVALLSSDVLVLAQPVFKIGEDGTSSQATVNLTASGSAKLQYDLEKQRIGLAQAKLTAQNVSFSLLGDGDKVADFGGTLVTNPVMTLKQLDIEVDRLSVVQVERAQLDTLSITANKISKDREPGSSTGLAYFGTPTKALTLASARAGRVKIEDDIALSLFSLTGLDFGIKDATLDFGSGVELAHAALDLRIGGLTETEVLGKKARQVQGVSLSADGKIGVRTPGFSINDRAGAKVSMSLDGLETALNGTGTIDIGTFTGNARSVFTINFDCRDTHHLDVDMETNFLVGGVSLNAKMHDGKLSGDGGVGPIVAAVHSTGATGCKAPSVKHIIAEQGKYWTDGICSKGLEFYSCRWESPEVSYSYHIALNIRLLTAAATFTNPHLYLEESGDVKFCNIGAVAVGGVVVAGGYSPGIDTPYPDLDNIVNGIIQASLEPIQTTVATGLGTAAGWLVTPIATGAGNLMCIGKKL